MIRHYFLHFVRSLERQRLYSLVNLFGLSISIGCAVLIYLYVRHEVSYDHFHHHADRIFRVNQTFIWGENDAQFASTGPGVAYAIGAEIPEIELITSIHTPGPYIVRSEESGEGLVFEEENVLAADSAFFRMFSFPMIAGNPLTALAKPNTLVMTASTAKKYFGEQTPVGKLVYLQRPGSQRLETFEVTGIVKDPPDNSYIQFGLLLSIRSFPVDKMYWSWVWTQLETYVRIREGASMETIMRRLGDIPRVYAEETLQRIMNTSFDDYVRSGKKWELFLQPLTSIHLPEENVMNRLNDAANLKTVYSLGGAAIVIILLACINFMNLSTARFTRRLREASIRKVLGLGNRELAVGYLFEALLFCTGGLICALALTEAMLPIFNAITGKALTIDLLTDTQLLTSMFLLVVIMALLASSYPIWFFTKFKPASAIKGKIRTGHEGKSFRNGLVVFQFAISIFLMITTGVVFQQLNFVANKDLGFDPAGLLVVRRVESMTNAENFTEESLSVPGVASASRCSSLPPHIFGGDKFSAEGMSERSFPLNFTTVDERFISTLNLTVRFGRSFSTATPADSLRVVLNETAVKAIGWPLDESVIGRKLNYPNGGDVAFEVAGVVADFNYWSLQTPIEPLGLFHISNEHVHGGDRKFVALRVEADGLAAWQRTLDGLRDVWKKHAGDVPFEYTFVDDVFAETFRSQQQLGKVLLTLALLAWTIAGLGLLGILLYALEQRMKEIGIRKISGATPVQLVWLISGGYSKLIFLAFLLAAPLAYWSMNQWLEDFAYRITPSIGVFLLAGGAAVALGFFITAYHSVKAAQSNPVDILRDE